MVRTANICVRVEPEVKTQAENVLKILGIPMSNAVSMFLKQVVLQKGIPFEMKIPVQKHLALGTMSKEELDSALHKGLDDIKEGRVHTSAEVKAGLKRKYGI